MKGGLTSSYFSQDGIHMVPIAEYEDFKTEDPKKPSWGVEKVERKGSDSIVFVHGIDSRILNNLAAAGEEDAYREVYNLGNDEETETEQNTYDETTLDAGEAYERAMISGVLGHEDGVQISEIGSTVKKDTKPDWMHKKSTTGKNAKTNRKFKPWQQK